MRVRWPLTAENTFWLIVVLAAVLKLAIAFSTVGTNDVLFFQAYADKVRTEGPVALYRDGIVLLDAAGRPRHSEGFFHPPFIVHLLEFLSWARNLTGLSFPFLFRLLSIAADIGSAFFMRDLLKKASGLAHAHLVACLFAGAPLLILISGFHGNTDPIMIFFLILCAWLLTQRRIVWLAGLAFGMSCEIKISPLILVPVVVLYIPTFRDRFWFSICAAGIFLLGALPVLAEDPSVVASRMFGYVSLFGHWGLARILPMTGPVALLIFYSEYGRYLVMLAAVVLGVWLQWKTNAALPIRIGLVTAIFLAFTPGFGIQYLTWLLPWVAFLGAEAFLIYLITTGLFMFHVYTFWSNGFPWNLADSLVVGTWQGFIVWHELICWLSILLCVALFWKAATATMRKPEPVHAPAASPDSITGARKKPMKARGPGRPGITAMGENSTRFHSLALPRLFTMW